MAKGLSQFIGSLLAALVLAALVTSCSVEKGSFLSLGQDILVVIGQDANHRVVAMYDLDGVPLGYIADFRAENATPRGIAPYDANSFLVALDTTDHISRVFFDGTKETFYGSNYFSGAIYQLAKGNNGRYYSIESNNIEVFDANGSRLSPITTTVGSCVLSAPRGSVIDSNGYLVVTNQGGTDQVLRYDISADTVSCVSNQAFGNNPYGVVAHSDGYLYIATQGDDQVYRADPDGSNATSIWATDLTIIRDPTALLEMPDGTLLVASSYTDTIEQLQTDGTRVGSTPFIKDSFSLNVSHMMILRGDEE